MSREKINCRRILYDKEKEKTKYFHMYFWGIHTCLCLDKVWQDTRNLVTVVTHCGVRGLELEMVEEEM